MAMFRILALCLLWINQNVQAQSFPAGALSWNLMEDEKDDHRLGCVPCIHHKPIRVSLQSVTILSGSFLRCSSCFHVRRISPTSDFCVFYSANTVANPTEYLARADTQIYQVTLECTDGTASTQKNIDVNVIPNAAPVITGPTSVTCPSAIDALTTPAFSYVYTSVAVTDSNDDVIIYSMTSDPVNDVFDIEPSSGRIYTKRPVSNFCNSNIIFYVGATDNTTAATGNLIVTCYISNPYDSPVVTNADRDVYIGEDAPVDSTIHTFLTSTPTVPVIYYISSVLPLSAARLFKIAGNTLQTAAPLNYETDSKNSRVTVTVDNGFCPPSQYFLDVNIQDRNDPPVVTPNAFVYTDVEGTLLSFDLSPVLPSSVSDEDSETIFDYSITAGDPSSLWTLSGTTLLSTVTWDREVYGGGSTLTLQVADRGGPATDTITVTIVVTDEDDHPPTLAPTTLPLTATECTTPGTVLGTLAATDADTSAYGNNMFIFDTVTAMDIAVNAVGQIYVLNNLTSGSTPTLSAGAKSVVTPAITSPADAVITVTVNACPPAGAECNSGGKVAVSAVLVVALAVLVSGSTCRC